MRYLFIILMIAAVLGANVYVFYRIWHLLPAIPWLRWAVLAVGVLAFASMFVSILAGADFPLPVTTVLYKVGTSWLFIMLYLLMIFLVLDFFRVTDILGVRSFMYGSWAGTIGVVVLITAIFGIGNLVYHNKKRVEFTVDTQGMVAAPVKIVAASDLHLGYGIGPKELARWVDMINSENPDIIVFAGDVIDNSVKPLYELDMAAQLRKLRSKYGVWASLGNHEYISGVDASLGFLKEAGINVLKDTVASIDGLFYLAGRDDATNGNRKELSKLLSSIDPGKAVVLLDHQPDALEKLLGEKVTLQLSGHTHRGQVWPISWITDAIFERSYGLLERYNTTIYVSSGLGIWGGKFRIGTRSEYMVVTIR